MMIWLNLFAVLMYVTAPSTLVCDYTVRDIGFVEFAPTRLRIVVLLHEELDEARQRDVQRELNEQAVAPNCLAWNLQFQCGTVANLPDTTEAQQAWSQQTRSQAGRDEEASQWSCWLVRGDGQSRFLVEGTWEQRPAWEQLLATHLQPPLITTYQQQALGAFAQLVLFESSDPEATLVAEGTIERAIEALKRAESLLPRPIAEPVKVIRVAASERERYETLLWGLHDQHASGETEAAVCTLYGRGRLAGPIMHGEGIQVAPLLAQLVLVGQSCECGTQRNWVQYPHLPVPWSEAALGDMPHHLGFDPSSSLVIEEVKRIVQRGPQSLPNGRDDVGDVVSSTLSLEGGQIGGTLQATVIQGDGWEFDRPVPQVELPAAQPQLLAIPPGRTDRATEPSTPDGPSSSIDSRVDSPITAVEDAATPQPAVPQPAVPQPAVQQPAIQQPAVQQAIVSQNSGEGTESMVWGAIGISICLLLVALGLRVRASNRL